MRLRIRHESAYSYAERSRWVAQTIRLTPVDGPAQRVLAWRVSDERGSQLLEFHDGYGNACHLLTRRDAAAKRCVIAEGEVETLPADVSDAREPLPPGYFLRATPLTAASPAIAELAASARTSTRPAHAELLALAAGVCARVAHAEERTGVATPAADALAGGAGVCQDRAHVFLAAARSLGYPARYVSGYWAGAADAGAGAMHAWAEAWCREAGWIALDPSNGAIAGERHVRVAVGLDYAEAAPIRGIQHGGTRERLDVRVRLQHAQQQ